MPDSNSTVTQADIDVTNAILGSPTMRGAVQLAARHRQSSSNAGGVDEAKKRTAINGILAGLLLPLVADPKELIALGNQACTEILASLSTPTAEPVQEMHELPNTPPTPDRIEEPCCGEYIAGSRCPACPDRIGKDAVLEAAARLLEYADLMPKETPAAGGCSTKHSFEIDAGTIWTLATRADELRAALSATPAQEGVTCETCGGYGELFEHSSECESDYCALAGGIEDCNGQVVPCHCATPAQPVDETERLRALRDAEWMNLMPREVVARAALNEGCRDETADNIRYGFHRDVKIRAEVAVKLVASLQNDVRAALQHKGEVSRG